MQTCKMLIVIYERGQTLCGMLFSSFPIAPVFIITFKLKSFFLSHENLFSAVDTAVTALCLVTLQHTLLQALLSPFAKGKATP